MNCVEDGGHIHHAAECPLADLSGFVQYRRGRNLARIAALIGAMPRHKRPVGRDQVRAFARTFSAMFGHEPLAACESALLDRMLREGTP